MSESCGELPPPKGQNANDKQRAMTIPTTTFRALGPGTVLLAQVPYYSVSNLPSALSQRDALTLLTSEEPCPIDKEMKRVLRNEKKQSLFVGKGGRRTAAILASLTSGCRRHDMDPHFYFMCIHSWLGGS